jgi:hypothetical protein
MPEAKGVQLGVVDRLDDVGDVADAERGIDQYVPCRARDDNVRDDDKHQRRQES